MLDASARDYLLLALGSTFLALATALSPFIELKSAFASKVQSHKLFAIFTIFSYIVGASATFVFLKAQTSATMSLTRESVLISLVALAALPVADRIVRLFSRSDGPGRGKSIWVVNLIGGISSALLALFAIVAVQTVTAPTLLVALLMVPLIVSVGSAVAHLSQIFELKTPWIRTGIFLASLGLLGASSSAISSSTSFALGGSQPQALAKVSSSHLPKTNRQISSISASQEAGLSSYYLSFKGVETVSKPNFHQVVKVGFFGSLDNGRGGRLHILAWGVPQPDGSLALDGSNTLAQIRQIKLNGMGPVKLFTARAVRGTLLFPGNRYYDYLLSFTPTGETTVKGEFVLYPRHGGPQSSSLV